jgi:hypothetical protein
MKTTRRGFVGLAIPDVRAITLLTSGAAEQVPSKDLDTHEG